MRFNRSFRPLLRKWARDSLPQAPPRVLPSASSFGSFAASPLLPTTRKPLAGHTLFSAANSHSGINATNQSRRAFSSYSLQSERARPSSSEQDFNANPSYQVYGEATAFTVKAIPPEFRVVGGAKNTVVLDGSKKGRLLFEWVERSASAGGKFAWDKPLRFALSPEEVGLFLFRLRTGQPFESARQTRPTDSFSGGYGDISEGGGSPLQKVLRAHPHPDGSLSLTCDYELDDGTSGQEPPTPYEARGPLQIHLMVGEQQVLQSIMEYSIPRLTGWAPLMDHSVQKSWTNATNGSNDAVSPHNYSGRGGPRGGGGGGFGSDGPGDGVPF